jgi:hypothetical protein
MMTPAEALVYAESLHHIDEIKDGATFYDYAQRVLDRVRALGVKERETKPGLYEFLQVWAVMLGEFDSIVDSDPMVLYRPKNHASAAFHASQAFIRYFRGGNRTSKTQSGYAEDYFYATGQHPFKQVPPAPANVFIVSGLPYTTYASKVFEAKLVIGEPGNYLSPMFPEGGKWFNHYDSRNRTVTLGCLECAEKGQAGSCPSYHVKSKIYLFSTELGHGILEAFSGRVGHFDEHVPEKFYHAGKQRIMGQAGGCLLVTGTPLHGMDSWETRLLAAAANGAASDNAQSNGQPLVTMHEISQYDAGIATSDQIANQIRDMDEFEIESRIYGKPAPLAEFPVFDRKILADIRRGCVAAAFHHIEIISPATLESAMYPRDVKTTEYIPMVTKENQAPIGWRIWEKPTATDQYVMGVDSAAGLSARDPSCASVFKVIPTPEGYPAMHLVAQYWGWTNMFDYADEIKKGALLYNCATVVIELTGGYGRGVMDRLKRQLYYWNIFRDTNKAELVDVQPDARHGVDTNVETKPLMVGCLQQAVKNRLLHLKCADTLRELLAFGQERTESGLRMRYRGMGDRDDRVMSCAIAAYTIFTYTNRVYNFLQASIAAMHPEEKAKSGWEHIRAHTERAGASRLPNY